MERFLRYSWERQKPIRIVYQAENGKLQQRRGTVLALEAESFRFACKRPREELLLRLDQLLSADYVPGDEGGE